MSPPGTDLDDLKAILADSAQQDARGGGAQAQPQPPDPDELLAYLEGDLPASDKARIERRLAADPAASQALLDLADLAAAEPPAEGQTADLATQAGWRDLRRRLPRPGRRRWPLLPLLAAAACLLLVATIVLALRLAELAGGGETAVANLVTLELTAARAAGEPRVELAEGEPLRLVLRPPSGQVAAPFQVEIVGPRPDQHRILGDLERNRLGNLDLLLASPAPGRYLLRLLGGEPPVSLEEHAFHVVRPPPPADAP